MAISVVIHTQDSAKHLARVLDTVAGFDEVLVCDMESVDSTPDIAREAGARLLTFPRGEHFQYDRARKSGLKAASSEWVLLLEPDELVSPALREYLYKFIKNPGDSCGLYLPRKDYIFNRLRNSQYPGYQLRFFKRKCTVWPDGRDGAPMVEGHVGRVPSRRMELALVHIPRDLSTLLDHLNRYTSNEARRDLSSGINLFQIVTEPFGRFLHTYFIRGTWRYGIAGYISAVSSAVYRYYTLAKRYEEIIRQREETNPTGPRSGAWKTDKK